MRLCCRFFSCSIEQFLLLLCGLHSRKCVFFIPANSFLRWAHVNSYWSFQDTGNCGEGRLRKSKLKFEFFYDEVVKGTLFKPLFCDIVYTCMVNSLRAVHLSGCWLYDCMVIHCVVVTTRCALFVFVSIYVIHFAFFCERIVPQLLARDYAL